MMIPRMGRSFLTSFSPRYCSVPLLFCGFCSTTMSLFSLRFFFSLQGSERSGHQVASSPPYFCGSPPSRASNPVIQDAQFGNEKVTPFSRAPSPARKPAGGGGGGGGGGAGGVRMMKFGSKPAAVRIEGFDCLGRDGQSRSISAVA